MLNVGEVLDGKYEVIRVLGKGGMGTVYLCRNKRLDNLWSIKEVRKENLKRTDFMAEPRILRQLSHPGIPRIVDIFEERDNLYMVMDYIEGESLEEHIRRVKALGERRIAEIALELCGILKYLHSLDPPIIYRDLKPSNILITPEGKVKLIDFGISRVYKENQERDTMIMGSNGYAAPEQYGGAQTSIRSDIYGLGATIYYMAAGESPPLVVHMEQDKNYRVKISEGIGRIIERAMQLRPEDRYENMSALEKELSLILDPAADKTVLLCEDDSKTLVSTAFLGRNEERVIKKRRGAGLKVSILGFILIVLFISGGVFYALRDKDKNQSTKEKGKPTVNEKADDKEVPKQEAEAVKEIDVIGVIYKKYPASSKENISEEPKGKAKGKKKDKKNDNKEYILLYKLNPESQKGILENSIIGRIDSIEVNKDDLIVFCTIENNTGNDIGLYKSRTVLTIGNGEKAEAHSLELVDKSALSDNGRGYRIKISFKDVELKTGNMLLRINMSLKKEPQEAKEMELKMEVR